MNDNSNTTSRSVQVIYRAFPRAGEPVATQRALLDIAGDDLEICEMVFANTNLYRGQVWDALQPLPTDRTHTSLSVGDVVLVDGRAYECASFGFERAAQFDTTEASN